MSSKSTIVRNERIAKTVAKYAEKRKQLKKEGNYAALAQLRARRPP